MRTKLLLVGGLMLAGAMARLLPHPPNVTPVLALGLFGGAILGRSLAAWLLPLGAMLLSDLVLGFHSTLLFVYAGMLSSVAIGQYISGRLQVLPLAGGTLLASSWFFLLTNLGVWLTGDFWPRTAEGLLACYVSAIPFFGYSLAGDFFFSAFFLGSWTFAIPRLFPGVSREAM